MREASGYGRNRNIRTVERLDRGANHLVVDANGADLDFEGISPQRLQEVTTNGLACLGAQPLDCSRSVVPGESRQIHTGDGSQEPGSLPVFFDGSPSRKRGSPAFDGGAINLDRLDPIEVERDAWIPIDWLKQMGNVGRGH